MKAVKTPVLLNTSAGALHATPSMEQIGEVAERLGVPVEVIPAGPPEAMKRKVRELVEQGHPKIAVAGGDGTVHLAVQQMAKSGVALGIIPQGTANNFATALRLPQELEAAIRVIGEGNTREVDLGRIGDSYFTEAAGVGLFADALALYGSRSSKNPFRMMYALWRLFFSLHAHRIRLTADDKTIMERAVMCTVANTYRMGLGDPMAPGARLSDGQLDIVVVGDLSRRELITYYRAMKAQAHLDLPKVTSLKARKVTIESRARMRVHSDDRIIGTTPVTITAEPRALKVIVEKT
jgi:diacylglycerol kinase (ATP)